jgi:hypothetical protein
VPHGPLALHAAWSSPWPRSLGPVIASRRFRIRGRSRAFAEVRIGTPRPLEDQDAYCPVQLVGIGDEKVRPISGVDTVQALQLAVRYLDPLLLRFGDELTWEGQPAHKSLNTDPWALFEDAGLSEFLLEFGRLCSEHAARARSSSARSSPEQGRRRERRA